MHLQLHYNYLKFRVISTILLKRAWKCSKFVFLTIFCTATGYPDNAVNEGNPQSQPPGEQQFQTLSMVLLFHLCFCITNFMPSTWISEAILTWTSMLVQCISQYKELLKHLQSNGSSCSFSPVTIFEHTHLCSRYRAKRIWWSHNRLAVY